MANLKSTRPKVASNAAQNLANKKSNKRDKQFADKTLSKVQGKGRTIPVLKKTTGDR